MRLDFETDQGNATKAALGVIVLQTDETLENELRQACDIPGLALYHARIPSHPLVTAKTLLQMKKNLPATAALFPDARPMDAIGYACTSGATVIGPDVVAAEIGQIHPGIPVTNPISAVMEACRALQVRKLGFLTPYLPEVSAAMRDLLQDNGFQISAFGSFEQGEERVISRISEGSTLAALERLGADPNCEAVFASCTNLRSFGILAKAEARIGKPVISSNQAFAWHLLKLAGVRAKKPALGRLFSV